MGIRDKLVESGMFPDIGGLTNQMNEKFGQLLGELQAMHAVLDAILAELRTQRGAPR